MPGPRDFVPPPPQPGGMIMIPGMQQPAAPPPPTLLQVRFSILQFLLGSPIASSMTTSDIVDVATELEDYIFSPDTHDVTEGMNQQ